MSRGETNSRCIAATFDGCGRRWFYGAGIVTIEGTSIEFELLSIPTYDTLQVIPLIKRVIAPENTTIKQLVLLLPSFGPFLPVLLPEYPNAVTVTVSGFEDPATIGIPECNGEEEPVL